MSQYKPLDPKSKVVGNPSNFSVVKYDLIATSALQLWELGLNVFPRPTQHDDQIARAAGGYLPLPLQPLYNNRLHVCTDKCMGHKHTFDNATFEALFSHHSDIAVMLGRTSGNMIAVRCKNDSSQTVAQRFRDKSIRYYWRFSDDHYTYFLIRILEGEVCKRSGGGLHIMGDRVYLALPPSISPSGRAMEWYKGHSPDDFPDGLRAISIDKLGWLDIKLKYDKRSVAREAERLSGKFSELSEPNKATFANLSSSFVLDPDNKKRLFALIADMAGHAIPKKEAWAMLIYPFREKRRLPIIDQPYWLGDVEDTLKSILKTAYGKGRIPAAQHFPASSKEEYWIMQAKIKAWADSYSWVGRIGNTDRRVVDALLRRMLMDRNLEFRASERELADLAGLERKAVRRALYRLSGREKGRSTPVILKQIGKTELEASIYTFLDGPVKALSKSSLSDSPGKSIYNGDEKKYTGPSRKFPRTDSEHDFVRKHGLMPFQIFKHLVVHPEHSHQAIATSLGIEYRSSVTLAMHKLENLHMVEKTDGNWSAISHTDEMLADLNNQLGADGQAARRRFEHQSEREVKINIQFAKRFELLALFQKRLDSIQRAKDVIARKTGKSGEGRHT